MPFVWVGIGSNQRREGSIRGAVGALGERFGELVCSSVYESPAVGFDGEPFFNLVVGFDTTATVGELDATFRHIEDRFGRVRGVERFAPRTLDIDLLTYGQSVGEQDGLILPREDILRYAFVLGPLAEVAPDELHPVEGIRYRSIWERFDRSSQPIVKIDLALPGGSKGNSQDSACF